MAERDAVAFKIVPTAVWSALEAAQATSFSGHGIDERDGFMHLSTRAQCRATAARYFAGVAGLTLLCVDLHEATKAPSPTTLKYEAGGPTGSLFPHLYGPLPLTAVKWVRPLPLGDDGHTHVFPAEFDQE